MDRNAISQLFLHHHDRLRAYVAPRISARHQAIISPEDILQDVYACATPALSSMDERSEEELAAWLTMVAEHKLIDRTRHEDADKRGGKAVRLPNGVENSAGSLVDRLGQIAADTKSPSQKLLLKELQEQLAQELGDLESRNREVIMQRAIEELSREEIAAKHDLSVNQVRGIVGRTLERLRDALRDSSL